MEEYREQVMNAPEMNEEMWAQLSTLFSRHQSIRSLFGWIMAEANAQAETLPNLSSATEEGREQVNLVRGIIQGHRYLVGRACDFLGDSLPEKEDEDEEDKEVKKRARRARQRREAPQNPVRRKK